MKNEVLHPHKDLSVYHMKEGLAVWRTLVIRNHTGSLWHGTTCDTLIISSNRGPDELEQYSIRIGNFYEVTSLSLNDGTSSIIRARVSPSSFNNQMMLRYIFIPQTQSIPVYLWTEENSLSMKMWYEDEEPYLGLVCKIDFLNYEFSKDFYNEFKVFLEESKLLTNHITDNSSWWRTSFQDDSFLLFLYKNPQLTKRLVNRFEALRQLVYAFTLDC